MNFKEELYGKRLTLRRTRPTPEMAELIFQVVDANREHLRPFCPWEKNDDCAESCLNYLKEKEIKTEAGERIEYGIFINEFDAYVGNIQVFDISEANRSGEFGYWLSKEATGHGYMKEAVLMLEKECFNGLNLHRIQICCDKLNIASKKVIESCNYTFEGALRESMYDAYRDAMRTTLVFAKLRWEYEKQL
jgi:ribosomal-protein-serine acetyltransferase